MAPQTLQAGRPVDIPTAAENGDELERRMRVLFEQQRQLIDDQERARERAVKLIRRDASLTTPAGTRFTLLDGIGPGLGYIWSIVLLSAQLASSSTFEAFITSDTSTATVAGNQRKLVAATTTNVQYPVFVFGKGRCPLFPDEGLFLNAGANIDAYFLIAWEVPAEMQGKLL